MTTRIAVSTRAKSHNARLLTATAAGVSTLALSVLVLKMNFYSAVATLPFFWGVFLLPDDAELCIERNLRRIRPSRKKRWSLNNGIATETTKAIDDWLSQAFGDTSKRSDAASSAILGSLKSVAASVLTTMQGSSPLFLLIFGASAYLIEVANMQLAFLNALQAVLPEEITPAILLGLSIGATIMASVGVLRRRALRTDALRRRWQRWRTDGLLSGAHLGALNYLLGLVQNEPQAPDFIRIGVNNSVTFSRKSLVVKLTKFDDEVLVDAFDEFVASRHIGTMTVCAVLLGRINGGQAIPLATIDPVAYQQLKENNNETVYLIATTDAKSIEVNRVARQHAKSPSGSKRKRQPGKRR